MFRIAAGEELGYDDPEISGHSIEFRINAEDAGRNFMPAPGTLTVWHPPSGPGVRVDGGYVAGETIPGSFDSLIAKLVVTGRDRTQALERSRRALAEFEVDGMPTVIPFHRAVVADPAFIGDGETFGIYTLWIENEFDNQITPYTGTSGEADEPEERQRVTVEVGGRRLEVVLPGGLGGLSVGGGAGGAKKPKRSAGKKARRRRHRRLGRLPDAGHHRQGRRRGGPERRGGRCRHRARGDEDGAAPQGPQGRHRHRPQGRGRRHRGQR